MSKTHGELVQYLFDHRAHALESWCARCMAESPRFAEFIAAHRSKVRKKIRLAADSEALRDLSCELAIAAMLCQERSFAVSYEPLAAQGAGPDFGIDYKGHTLWYLEVTRARLPLSVETGLSHTRLAALLCGKLRQLPAGAPTLLVLITDGFVWQAADLDAALRLLRQRAEAKDDAFFAFRGLESAKAFYRQIACLSAVLLVPTGPGEEPVFWPQRQARHPLPAGVAKVIAALRPTIDLAGDAE